MKRNTIIPFKIIELEKILDYPLDRMSFYAYIISIESTKTQGGAFMLNVPAIETVLGKLSGILPRIWSAVDFGTSEASEFFLSRGLEIDPWVASGLVRYFALGELGKLVPKDKQPDRINPINLETLPNNGIYMHYSGYHIRILKCSSGGIPYPGRSNSRQAFYQQCFNFYDMGLNILILWDVTPPYTLNTLYIACPKDSATYKEPIPTHWEMPIPDKYLFGTEAEMAAEETRDLSILSFIEPDAKEGGE